MKPHLHALVVAAILCGGAAGQQPRGGDRAPALGAAIPEVEAIRADGSGRVALGRPARLTVLVFGSYT